MSRAVIISKIAVMAGALFAAAPTFAQELRGGSLTFGHSAFVRDTSVSKTSLDGQVEVGFGRSIGLQLDLGISHLNSIGEGSTNATLHGIYHVSDQTSLGLFVGADRLSGQSLDFVGFEVGQEAAKFDIETYIAYGEDSGIDGTIAGFSGRYSVSDSFGIGGSVERGDIGGVGLTRFGLKGDYAATPNIALVAEVGAFDAPGTSTEAFVGLGGKFTFGNERGTTFGKRGVVNLIPGL